MTNQSNIVLIIFLILSYSCSDTIEKYSKQKKYKVINDIAWLKYGLNCKSLCGSGERSVLRKKDGKWKIVKRVADWVS
jgi:hypothetical protein